MIGREGMTGLAVVLDGDHRTIHETFMQIGGSGQCISAAELRDAIDASTTLHQVLLRFAHAFMIQATHTAHANGRSKIEERLARWLLMANDRVDGEELKLTHEVLATLLGVRRSGVTVALQELERTGLISHKRGKITILDRMALETSSNDTYFPISERLTVLFRTKSRVATCWDHLVACSFWKPIFKQSVVSGLLICVGGVP